MLWWNFKVLPHSLFFFLTEQTSLAPVIFKERISLYIPYAATESVYEGSFALMWNSCRRSMKRSWWWTWPAKRMNEFYYNFCESRVWLRVTSYTSQCHTSGLESMRSRRQTTFMVEMEVNLKVEFYCITAYMQSIRNYRKSYGGGVAASPPCCTAQYCSSPSLFRNKLPAVQYHRASISNVATILAQQKVGNVADKCPAVKKLLATLQHQLLCKWVCNRSVIRSAIP